MSSLQVSPVLPILALLKFYENSVRNVTCTIPPSTNMEGENPKNCVSYCSSGTSDADAIMKRIIFLTSFALSLGLFTSGLYVQLGGWPALLSLVLPSLFVIFTLFFVISRPPPPVDTSRPFKTCKQTHGYQERYLRTIMPNARCYNFPR